MIEEENRRGRTVRIKVIGDGGELQNGAERANGKRRDRRKEAKKGRKIK